jgi:hypothetical protein
MVQGLRLGFQGFGCRAVASHDRHMCCDAITACRLARSAWTAEPHQHSTKGSSSSLCQQQLVGVGRGSNSCSGRRVARECSVHAPGGGTHLLPVRCTLPPCVSSPPCHRTACHSCCVASSKALLLSSHRPLVLDGPARASPPCACYRVALTGSCACCVPLLSCSVCVS